MLADLRTVLEIVSKPRQQGKATQSANPASRRPSNPQPKVADRLSAEDIAAMVAEYLAGSTAKAVAAKYGISLSSAKRYIRKLRE